METNPCLDVPDSASLSSPQYPSWFNPNDRRKLLGFYNSELKVVLSKDLKYDCKDLPEPSEIEIGCFFIERSKNCEKIYANSGKAYIEYYRIYSEVDRIKKILNR